MRQLTRALCLLFIGVYLGWRLHGVAVDNGTDLPTALPLPALADRGAQEQPDESIVLPPLVYGPTDSAGSTKSISDAQFRQLLTTQAFDEALEYYEQALSLDARYRQVLKPVLEHYLKYCMVRCEEGVFVDLVNIWLDAYYQDIPVLLLLAEHQRLQGHPEEAAGTLQLAVTYALQEAQLEEVNNAVLRLVQSTDESLSRAENWVELLGFYEYLHTLGLGTRELRLRESVLYRIIGETERSHDMLLELRDSANDQDPEWAAAVEAQLSLSTPQKESELTPVSRSGHTIAVTSHGDHFFVDAMLNRSKRVTLLIDTGASMTTLSRASFDRISTQGFKPHGARMFNTANGLTRAEVYRTSSVGLGDTELDDVDIAVMDYQSAPGVDGLLGMNVLRHFQFEIDRDSATMYLRPR